METPDVDRARRRGNALRTAAGFCVGVACTLLTQRLWPRPPPPPPAAPPGAGFFGDGDAAFDPMASLRQMDKMRQNMMANLNSMNSFQINTGSVQQREDAKFVYYDIPIKGLDPKTFRVKIEDGQIVVDGQTAPTPGSAISFTSSFHRSFPIPDGVDGAKVKMEQDKEKLTLKFPRV